MSKFFSLILLTIHGVFAQADLYKDSSEEPKEVGGYEKRLRFGVHMGFNINNFSFGDKNLDENIETGSGLGVGLALNVPIVSILRFNIGLDYYYRELFVEWGRNMHEHAVSVPVLFQIGKTYYLATGTQFDIPISGSYGGYFTSENRSSMDIGLVLGFGIKFTNVEFDLKYVYGLTGPLNDFKDKSWLGQYGIGVSYFF
jgi:hypothetical protein